jgi:hypothetical protein
MKNNLIHFNGLREFFARLGISAHCHRSSSSVDGRDCLRPPPGPKSHNPEEILRCLI